MALSTSLTRRTPFSAQHRYYRKDWTPAENSRVFGPAASADFHGHDYLCDVTVTGRVDESSGMLVNLVALDDALRVEVHERFDGRRINLDVAEFRDGGLVPSCENLARFLFGRIQAALGDGAVVESVVVKESDTLSAGVRRG